MARRGATSTDKTPVEKVKLWSGHDVNLTIPTRSDGMFSRYATVSATLGDLRAFLRAAQDAGYDDTTLMSVDVSGLGVRRDGRKP